MKKVFFVLLLLIFSLNALLAQNNTKFPFDIEDEEKKEYTLKMKFSVALDNIYGSAGVGNGEGNTKGFSAVDFLIFYIEDYGSNLGLKFNPLSFIGKTIKTDDVVEWKGSKTSILNLELSYSLNKQDSSDKMSFFFGPFVNINYLIVKDDRFDYDDFVLSSGLRLSMAKKFKLFKKVDYFAKTLAFDVGFRRVDLENTVYIAFSTDIVGLICGIREIQDEDNE